LAGRGAQPAALIWIGFAVIVASASCSPSKASTARSNMLLDHAPPRSSSEEIGRAKDAAAGAVLIASLAAAGIGGLALLSAL
jgi:hypothetical protein